MSVDDRVLDGCRHYPFDKIHSRDRCEEIAAGCNKRAFWAKVQAVASAVLAVFSLAFTFWSVRGSTLFLAQRGLSQAAFLMLPVVASVTMIPFLMLAMLSAKCWQRADHLSNQFDLAEQRIRTLSEGV